MSGTPIRIGTDQLPDPPIIAGITIKKRETLKHYKVDDSHQEFDRWVVLIPYESVVVAQLITNVYTDVYHKVTHNCNSLAEPDLPVWTYSYTDNVEEN